MSVNNKREYEITLNVNSSVSAPTMQLYNTDENIFNIKVFVAITEDGRARKLSHDELANYKLIMQVVKPVSNQYKEVEGVLDTTEDFVLFEMPKNTYDQVGTYKCQIKVTDDKGDGDSTNDEILTSRDFTYSVKPSLLTGLSADISTDPEVPILQQLIDEIKIASGMTVDDPNTIIGGLTIDSLDTDDKTLEGAINEVNESAKAVGKERVYTKVTTTGADTLIVVADDYEHGKRYVANSSANALTVVADDTDPIDETTQIKLSEVNKYGGSFVVGNTVKFEDERVINNKQILLSDANKYGGSFVVGDILKVTESTGIENKIDKIIADLKNMPVKTEFVDNKLYLVRANGTRIDLGTFINATGGTSNFKELSSDKVITCAGITLNNTTLTFTSTNTQTLIATVTPTDTTDTVVWSVDDDTIATVSNGVVTPVTNGSCTITATCGTKTATCNVTISGI